jgi:hypothetical protein
VSSAAPLVRDLRNPAAVVARFHIEATVAALAGRLGRWVWPLGREDESWDMVFSAQEILPPLSKSLRNVDHDNVCVFDCRDLDDGDIFDGGAVARMNSYAVDVDGARRRHQVGAWSFAKRSTDWPTVSLAPSTRARARMGSASMSLSKPLAKATKRP